MNLFPHLRADRRGSAFIAAAVSSGILAILVAGLLSYLGNEYYLNYRSHRWTQALHLAEAGVEYALGQFIYKGNNFQSAPAGWTLSGGQYTTTLTNLNHLGGDPIGTVEIQVTGVGTGNPHVRAIGTVANIPFGPTVARAVQITLTGSSTFPTALATKNSIQMNGNNISVDSFDSTDPAKSNSGLYDAAKRQPNGNVGTNSGLDNSVDVGNADIYGQVATGPGGSVAIGANGSIGPTFVEGDRATTEAQGEANGWIRHDFQVDMPNATAPAGASSWTSVGAINNNTTLTGCDRRASSISLSGNRTLTINGNVRIYVDGAISISGNGKIDIQPGGSLEIYATGNTSLGGNGVVNQTGLARNNRFYGVGSATRTWSLSGNGYWVGTVYAPNTNLTMNGGGSDDYDMSGSIVANSITMNGHVNFHYDESLSEDNDDAGYTLISWQSLRYSGGTWVAE